jgi:transcriptional regulator with XRE-family HTH domain
VIEIMPPGLDSQAEIRRLTDALRTLIRLGGVSHRHIERELGLSTGYLTRILAGQVQLRVLHVLSICHVIDLPASTFFAALYPPRPPANDRETRLIRSLSHYHPEPVDPRDPESLLRILRANLDALEDQIRVAK